MAKLALSPERMDKREFCVFGTLGAVKIVHKGQKVISSASLFSDNGESISLVLPYIKLDSGGLVEGAAARVTGIWNAHSSEVQGSALSVARRNLEAEKTWTSWVDQNIGMIFSEVPHGLDIGWSWEPGANGASNPLRYNTWKSI
jgi:hypothetical protein